MSAEAVLAKVGVGPQPEMGEDFSDGVGLVNNRDDAHRAPTAWTLREIGLRDLRGHLGPALLHEARVRIAKYKTKPSALPLNAGFPHPITGHGSKVYSPRLFNEMRLHSQTLHI